VQTNEQTQYTQPYAMPYYNAPYYDPNYVAPYTIPTMPYGPNYTNFTPQMGIPPPVMNYGSLPTSPQDLTEDALANLLMAWYYAGFFTGQYMAMKKAR